MLTSLTNALRQTVSLSDDQISAAVSALVDQSLDAELKADFLTALARKGETVEEITGFARELRQRSVALPPWAPEGSVELLDVCGTGGDRLNTFNISTTVALLASAAGIPVAKHGNRAITSKSGSADVLEALRVPIQLSPEQAARSLREQRFAFLFAPRYHPSFQHIAPARKLCAEQGQRTIFNILGPLLNPARPTAQLVGVPSAALCEPLARVLQSLGLRRAMVVSGKTDRGELDELSILGENMIAEFYQRQALRAGPSRLADGLPILPATLEDLSGGDATQNARTIERILAGEERGPKRQAVLLNAGAALFVAGAVRSLGEGWEMASSLIDSGRGHSKLEELRRFRADEARGSGG